MAKSINAKEIVVDIRSGLSDAELKEKYKLSDKGLDSVRKKLQAAGLIQPKKKTESTKPAALAVTKESSDFDSALISALAEDVKKGLHDNELMRRHELAPSALKKLLSELVARGYLTEDELALRSGNNSVLCVSCSGKNLPTAETCRHCGRKLGETPEHELPDTHAMSQHRHQEPELSSSSSDELWHECPWEERENYGLWKAYFQTAWKSLLSPQAFFSKLPPDSGYGNPILFAIVSVALSTPLALVILMLLGKAGGAVTLVGVVLGFVCAFIGAAIVYPVVLLVVAGLVHLMLMIQGVDKEFQRTFRVTAYSSAPHLLESVPVIGALFATVYSIVLMIIGLREMHETTTAKSAIAVLSVSIVLGLLILALYAIRT
jgi:ribosomal protein L40E